MTSGGRFFFIAPFVFPFHGHPSDFRRWSRQGIEAEFVAVPIEGLRINGMFGYLDGRYDRFMNAIDDLTGDGIGDFVVGSPNRSSGAWF